MPERVQESARPEREARVEAQLEDGEQQVRERRRVLEVMRVEPAADHVDGVRNEVLLLVHAVDERQAVLDRPQPQRQAAEHDPAQRCPTRHVEPGRPASPSHLLTPGAFPFFGVPVPIGTVPKPCLQLFSR